MSAAVHHSPGGAAVGDRSVVALIDRFFAARRPLKDSPHTTAAYRRDLAAITAALAAAAGVDPADVTADQLSAAAVRDAFGDFSSGHAKTSISHTPETLLRSAALPRPRARRPGRA